MKNGGQLSKNGSWHERIQPRGEETSGWQGSLAGSQAPFLQTSFGLHLISLQVQAPALTPMNDYWHAWHS